MISLRDLRNICAEILAQYIIQKTELELSLSRIPNSAIIPLLFHNPRKETFEKLLTWFSDKGFIYISTKQLFDILKGDLTLDKRAIWISFDDGWKENITNVVPYLTKAKIPAIFFISTAPIQDNGIFWFSYARANRRFLQEPYRKNVDMLWDITEEKRRLILRELANKTNKNIMREVMHVADVKWLSQNPLITIAPHGANHIPFDSLSATEQIDEVIQCQNCIEQWTGQKNPYFSYPKGRIGQQTPQNLESLGITLAATTQESIILPGSNKGDMMHIPRLSVPDDAFFGEAICHALGIWQPIINKAKKRIGLDPAKEIVKRYPK